jgi:murein DD-endopeptidase MepM/ murein hydrolase activator NlpD
MIKKMSNYFTLIIIWLIAVVHPPDAKAQFNTLGKSAARKSNSTPKDNSGAVVKAEKASDTLKKGNNWSAEMPRLHAPLRSLIITSGAGRRVHPVTGKLTLHQGIDLRAYFEPVFAVMDGLVEKAGYDERSGFFIRLNHSPLLKSSYAHLSEIKVKEGEAAHAGQVIGISGNSGTSTGPHLHFKIRYTFDASKLASSAMEK